MSKQVYQIDVLMLDNSTHKIVKVALLDDELALVKQFAVEVVARQLGAKSITITVDSPSLPMTLDGFNNWLHNNVPMKDRAGLPVLDKAATVHK